jgi:methyl coenzyme M reductase subunit D
MMRTSWEEIEDICRNNFPSGFEDLEGEYY